MASYLKRFYKMVAIAEAGTQSAYLILLDGKTLKTPAGAELLLPNARLAEAVAEEWRAQGAEVIFAQMPLTRLAFTAIDRVSRDRDASINQIAGFANSDVVCYRAGTPLDLVKRQKQGWDPLLRWASDEMGVALETVEGVEFVRQPEASQAKIVGLVSDLDDFALAGVRTAAELCGSAVIALGLLRGVLDAECAFAAAFLDELYQTKRWGEDFEAKARREDRRNTLKKIEQFLNLTKDS